MAALIVLACLVSGFSTAMQTDADEYITVSIPPMTGDGTIIEIKAKNPADRTCMGTIAVTIDGGGPEIPQDPKAYHLFPPDGSGRLAVFTPHGDGWKMTPGGRAVMPSRMHVELYGEKWDRGVEKTLRFPVTFTRAGPVQVLIRATFSHRVDKSIVVDWNIPQEGQRDEQGLPCLVREILREGGPGDRAGADTPVPAAVPPGMPDSAATAPSAEREYADKAESIVLSKSKKNTHYKVLQSLELGSLCIEGQWNEIFQEFLYDGDPFFWVDSSNAYTADEEKFSGDLYWCGTYSYTTAQEISKTVNAYTADLDRAVAIVRRNFGLYNAAPSEETTATPRGEENVTVLGSGTGFFVTGHGHVLTNYHVVSGEGVIVVVSENQEPRAAEIVSADEQADLALLKIEGVSVPVAFGSAAPARLGQTVFAIGYPSPNIQGISPKVTMGIISSLSGLMNDARSYQIDAAVQPGNSGGPLFSATGEVIGVVFARINDKAYSQATGAIAQKINYAIKNSYVLGFLQRQPDIFPQIVRGTVGAKTQEEAVGRISPSVVLVVVFKEQE